MKKINMGTVSKDYMGDSLFEYPGEFMHPLPALIRTAYVQYIRANREEEHEFTFPGYGVLWMQNRNYRFTPEEKYGKRTPSYQRLEGVWG